MAAFRSTLLLIDAYTMPPLRGQLETFRGKLPIASLYCLVAPFPHSSGTIVYIRIHKLFTLPNRVLNFSDLIQHFPYLGLFILLVLGGMGLPFPEGASLILCGFLISTHVIDFLPALVFVYAGILTGDLLFYLVGRKYGRMIVTHTWFNKIISPKRLSLFEEEFSKWGSLLILIGGRLFGEIFLAAGILKMPAARLLIVDAISAVLAIAFWSGIGYIGGKSLQIIQEDITRIEHLVILIIILLIVIWLFVRHFKSRERI